MRYSCEGIGTSAWSFGSTPDLRDGGEAHSEHEFVCGAVIHVQAATRPRRRQRLLDARTGRGDQDCEGRRLEVASGPCRRRGDAVRRRYTGKYIDQFIDALRAQGKEILGKAQRVVFEHALKCESVLLETIGAGAADQIVAHAQQCNADLIVMGTHGRRGLRRLALGSDAELVVRSSPIPVLLVRGAAGDS